MSISRRLRPRLTLRATLGLIVIIAVALAVARLPIVWVALDARRIGNPGAVLKYIWLWVGFTMVVFLVRSPSRRLIDYGWVLIGALVIHGLCPQLQMGFDPDIAGYCNLASILATLALWMAGAILGQVTSRRAPENRDTDSS